MPTIDFTQVVALEPLPAGSYLATIVKAEEGMSENGNQKIDLQWKIEGEPFDGRLVFDTLTFTEKTMFRVKQALTSLGFPKDFKGDVTPDLLVGKTARIVVEIEASTKVDADGELYPPRNRVRKVKTIGLAAAAPVAPTGKRK